MGKRKSRSVVRLGKDLLSAGHSALDLPVSKMGKIIYCQYFMSDNAPLPLALPYLFL
jgi:hypothetical protein